MVELSKKTIQEGNREEFDKAKEIGKKVIEAVTDFEEPPRVLNLGLLLACLSFADSLEEYTEIMTKDKDSLN